MEVIGFVKKYRYLCNWLHAAIVGLIQPYIAAAAVLCVTDRAGVQCAAAQARAHGLWPAAIRSCSVPFNGLHPRNPCNYMDYYLFTNHGGMKDRASLPSWLTHSRQFIHKVVTGQLSTAIRAQVTQSPPAKNRLPNHWATPPTNQHGSYSLLRFMRMGWLFKWRLTTRSTR